MKKSCMLALLVLTIGFGAPAVGQTRDAPATASTDKNTAKAAAPEKKICRSEKITGTRSKVRRTCRTRAEWDQVAEATRRHMNEFDRATNGGAPALSDIPKTTGPS